MPVRKKNETKRKAPTKVKSRPTVQPKVDDIPTLPFHESFPITLEHKDGKEFKKCFFMCQEHCDSYIKRYKLKKGTYVTFPTVPEV